MRKTSVLFTNVHVFDGKSRKQIENTNVQVEDYLTKQVSTQKISAYGTTMIDGDRFINETWDGLEE